MTTRTTRTVVAPSEFVPYSGKWKAVFETWIGRDGEAEYLAFSCSSGYEFATAEEATEGAQRALAILEETDSFPNMCAPF